MKEKVSECLANVKYPEHAKKFKEYVLNVDKRYWLGVPTTCGYQHVFCLDRFKIFQFFFMSGLGSAVLLTHGIGHNFYGYLFEHNTSVCLAMDSQRQVWLSNSPSKIGYVYAWGGSVPRNQIYI